MRTPRLFLASVGTLALAVGLQPAGASTPDTSSIAVPKAGPKTVSTTWKGTLSPGANASASFTGCKDALVQQPVDVHKINISVPAGTYSIVKATMAVTVDSAPTLNGDIVEVLDPSGASAGIDQQKAEMEVDIPNPQPGTWTVLVCEFVPDGLPSHDYTAAVTIKTKCKGASPCPAAPRRKK